MSQSQSDGKTFFGHPIQLSTLFHIELWERFSFSGLQGILMFYLYYELSKGGLGMDKTVAGGIVGAYGGSVYFLRLFASPQISAQHKRHFVAYIPMFFAVSVFVALFM